MHKKPKLYYNPENSLDISFTRKPGWRVATPDSPAVFYGYDFSGFDPELRPAAVRGAIAVLDDRDTYSVAWDCKAGFLAYTDRNMEGQDWVAV